MIDRITQAQEFLLTAQSPEAGWGYTAQSKQPFPEPTCYSLLALANTDYQPESALNWLASLVNAQGQLILSGDDMPNWGSAHLVITLAQLNQLPAIKDASVNWLLNWEGNYSDPDETITLDSSLIGWPWISDTFSWVQPTSYAILALKQTGQHNHHRIKEAESLLLDRMCLQGGWNFGNPLILDQPIQPSVVDTAAASFALQDTPEAGPAVEAGIAVLEKRVAQFPSTLSLALSILCLNLYQRPAENLVDSLLSRQSANGSWRDNPWWTALAVLALQVANGGKNVFEI